MEDMQYNAVIASNAMNSSNNGETVASNFAGICDITLTSKVLEKEQQQVIARPTRRPRVKKTMALLDGNTNWIYLQLQNPPVRLHVTPHTHIMRTSRPY